MPIMSRRIVVFCGLLCAIAAGLRSVAVPAAGVAASSVPPSAGGNPIAAVWKERRLDFFYKGRMARYSCDGLRDKVRALLLDLGARRDVKIVAAGCEDDDRTHGRARSSSLSIVFSAPALPSISAKPSTPGDLAAIDAHFEVFTMASDAFRNMGIGDCELVEEFTRQILPTLITRKVKRDIACMPDGSSGSRFLVQGEVLKTLPWKYSR